jgi:hypothetical protein
MVRHFVGSWQQDKFEGPPQVGFYYPPLALRLHHFELYASPSGYLVLV